ncbi:maleylpyruvate isomerase family mycothiol-dependent enzyme [Nocardioides iriomotensis]|uniref:Maleylpyruvate isomerase family mycothiol-dependent enzyme n=1 Tax=Nocardioides iriomotensis TaxID=715784 RepID=A0A4Q5J8B3_9ACTN|nr:maleylpyruvate isomerase family mycothiol-dependent enzyme [Nocardioides iriomotensis]RYU13915.1 maleylpyruvate isomerase family mycothiol-dependent enzyme [Nocardioides iriomotensis]
MSGMDKDTVWRYIHAERRALAGHLATLDAEQWEHDSLCAGWTVRDVAAHVISTPQIGWREVLRMTPLMLKGYHRAIFEVTKELGKAPVDDILAQYERYDGSTHHVPTTTHVEPLIDALVHTQDVLRPLGIEHEMPAEAAAFAADRAWLLFAPVFGTGIPRRGLRLVATDTDWTRGRGDRVVEAPMQELLMFVTGRSAARVSVPQ